MSRLRTVLTAIFAALVALTALAGPVQAQDSDDVVGAAAAMAIGEKYLNAPAGSYEYDASAFSVRSVTEGRFHISYQGADLRACRVAAAMAFWVIVRRRSSGVWDVRADCRGSARVEAKIDLNRSPPAYSFVQYDGGSVVFRTSWRGRR